MSKNESASKGAGDATIVEKETPKVIIQEVEKIVYVDKPEKKEDYPATDFLINEKVTIQYIKRESSYIKDPKHVGYGGLFEGSTIAIPVPLMDNMKMKNLLTKKEKAGLEFLLGRDLSIYKSFWRTDYKEGALFPIYLGKDDTVLDKSDPEQYIKWKVLKESPIVANSLDEIRNKATYRFVMIAEGETIKREKDKVGAKVMAFEKYVEFKNNKPVLRYILRNLGRYTAQNQKLDFLQIETARLIDKDPNMFLYVTTDELIHTKILLEDATEFGVINKVEGSFYTKDNEPISDGATPSLETAARYLSIPLGQEMRLTLEAKIKNARE
jgi:hypothetical protein